MDKKISELDPTLNLSDQADFPLSQDNGGEPTTFRAKLTQIATKIAEAITFSNLKTGDKQLVSAVNQTISNLADDFNTTAGSTYAKDDCVLYNGVLYQCINNNGTTSGTFINADWSEIKAVDVGSGGGGGGGTTDYEDLSNKPQVNSVELVGNKSLDDLGIMPALLSKTVSGSIAHITDGADNIPVKSLVSEIVAVESGSGEKSPDNPYTISGFDSGIITRCENNFLSLNNVDFTLKSVRYYTSGGDFYLNGTSTGETSSRDESFRTNLNFLLKAGTYYFSRGNTELATYLYDYYDDTKPAIVTNRGSFTLTEDTRVYIGFYIYNKTFDNLKSEIMVSVGSSATTYEAYNGNTYTFPFGQTVYGGHFDNKGNLVVTHIFGELVATSKNGNYFRATLSELGLPNIYDRNADLLCDRYAVADVTITTSNNNQITVYGEVGDHYAIRWVDLNYLNADVSTYNTAMASNKPKICYKLANPIILSITSQDIPTILGENNIFSDTGDVDVTYYTDKADEIVEVAKATASTPLHNYSTDEQIVGTWIDGSTLYQKSFVFTSSLTITDDWVSTPFSISGLDKIIDGIIWRVSSGGSVYIDTNVDGDNIRISTKSKNTNFAIGSVLTIRYTKSST